MLPLVSVAVITYNSSKTVVETLDSIYNQTYQNIELIISDDCSTDNTLDVCHKWVEQHKDRFVRTDIITVPKNSGVSANCNRAEGACNGEWIKPIAGDDMLLPECIEIFMFYVKAHPDAVYVFSKMQTFGATPERNQIVSDNFDYTFFDMTPEQQYDRLVRVGNCVPAPTSFYNKRAKNKLGLRFDERIPLMEDWPMWLNLLKAGVKLSFIPQTTVLYRVSESALSTNGNFSPAFRKSLALFCKYYQFGYLFKNGDKRWAMLLLLRAEKYLHDNGIFWRALLRLYKLIFRVK